MSVYEKLLQVQQELKAPKGQYNQFGNFHYRSCEDIQEAVKPLLSNVKAVLTVNDELVMIGSRYYIKATARFTDVEDGAHIENTAYARETESKTKMDDAQVTGSCSSYARKYALNGLFCIDDANDPDTMDNSNQDKQQTPQQRKPAAVQQAKTSLPFNLQNMLMAEADRTGTELKQVCARYKVKTIADLSVEQYQRAMSAFSKTQSRPQPMPENEQMSMFSNIDEYTTETPFR